MHNTDISPTVDTMNLLTRNNLITHPEDRMQLWHLQSCVWWHDEHESNIHSPFSCFDLH